MAKLGSGKRQMKAVLNKRSKKTNASANIFYKFLAAMCTYTALMFKYIFLAFWWVLKQLFKLMYAMLRYIYQGVVFLVKKIAEKFRKNEENKEE